MTLATLVAILLIWVVGLTIIIFIIDYFFQSKIDAIWEVVREMRIEIAVLEEKTK